MPAKAIMLLAGVLLAGQLTTALPVGITESSSSSASKTHTVALPGVSFASPFTPFQTISMDSRTIGEPPMIIFATNLPASSESKGDDGSAPATATATEIKLEKRGDNRFVPCMPSDMGCIAVSDSILDVSANISCEYHVWQHDDVVPHQDTTVEDFFAADFAIAGYGAVHARCFRPVPPAPVQTNVVTTTRMNGQLVIHSDPIVLPAPLHKTSPPQVASDALHNAVYRALCDLLDMKAFADNSEMKRDFTLPVTFVLPLSSLRHKSSPANVDALTTSKQEATAISSAQFPVQTFSTGWYRRADGAKSPVEIPRPDGKDTDEVYAESPVQTFPPGWYRRADNAKSPAKIPGPDRKGTDEVHAKSPVVFPKPGRMDADLQAELLFPTLPGVQIVGNMPDLGEGLTISTSETSTRSSKSFPSSKPTKSSQSSNGYTTPTTSLTTSKGPNSAKTYSSGPSMTSTPTKSSSLTMYTTRSPSTASYPISSSSAISDTCNETITSSPIATRQEYPLHQGSDAVDFASSLLFDRSITTTPSATDVADELMERDPRWGTDPAYFTVNGLRYTVPASIRDYRIMSGSIIVPLTTSLGDFAGWGNVEDIARQMQLLTEFTRHGGWPAMGGLVETTTITPIARAVEESSIPRKETLEHQISSMTVDSPDKSSTFHAFSTLSAKPSMPHLTAGPRPTSESGTDQGRPGWEALWGVGPEDSPVEKNATTDAPIAKIQDHPKTSGANKRPGTALPGWKSWFGHGPVVPLPKVQPDEQSQNATTSRKRVWRGPHFWGHGPAWHSESGSTYSSPFTSPALSSGTQSEVTKPSPFSNLEILEPWSQPGLELPAGTLSSWTNRAMDVLPTTMAASATTRKL